MALRNKWCVFVRVFVFVCVCLCVDCVGFICWEQPDSAVGDGAAGLLESHICSRTARQ